MQTIHTKPADDKNRQKFLGDKGLITLITLLSTFIPMSTDIYLPALPKMAVYFNAPVKLINLTLMMFFIFHATGTLFCGPLSDKYGRKLILVTGLAVYILASVFCACSSNVYQLIASRILQAIGSGATTAIATAMVKDVYEGRKRESVLALVYSMIVIAPIIAPILGAFILQFTSWRGVFWALSGIGFIALLISIMLEETLIKPYSGTIFQTIGRLGVVLKNPGFTFLVIIFSLTGIPMMAFITSSSYIYIDGFGLSEQVYSFYFAFNAICTSLGPMLYLRLSRQFKSRSIIIACFTTVALSGILIYSIGVINPWVFALSLIPASISFSALRPAGTNLMLEQQQADTGSVSSLMICFSILMASIGIILISFDRINMVIALGIMFFITGLLSGSLWLLISKRSFVKQLPV